MFPLPRIPLQDLWKLALAGVLFHSLPQVARKMLVGLWSQLHAHLSAGVVTLHVTFRQMQFVCEGCVTIGTVCIQMWLGCGS